MTQLTTPRLARRDLLKGTSLTVGAATLLRSAFTPTPAVAQGAISAGTVHSFATGGLRFHTYVSPPEAVHVTSHIVEFDDQLLLVDGTMLPPTAQEVSALVASTGKPIGMAVLSHEHPDHWGGAPLIKGAGFATLPQIREAVAAEAASGDFGDPANVLNGPDIAIGMTEMSGVPVEFRHYENTEAPHMVVTVLPEQKVAVVQDLVYNGVYFAPGVDRTNWIATLESFRDDPSFETLLVGHGLPTTRGELDTAIAYLKTLDAAWDAGDTPDAVKTAMMEAYPSYDGAFLLGLIEPYWDK